MRPRPVGRGSTSPGGPPFAPWMSCAEAEGDGVRGGPAAALVEETAPGLYSDGFRPWLLGSSPSELSLDEPPARFSYKPRTFSYAM